MNIIEAVKSGKSFRRKGFPGWKTDAIQMKFNDRDILADDWEIQKEPLEITACRDCMNSGFTNIMFSDGYCQAHKHTPIKLREVIE